jgi:hypothetical protein
MPKDQSTSSTHNIWIPDSEVLGRVEDTQPKNAVYQGQGKRDEINNVNDFEAPHILGEEGIYNKVSDDITGILCGGHGTQHGSRQNERGSKPYIFP